MARRWEKKTKKTENKTEKYLALFLSAPLCSALLSLVSSAAVREKRSRQFHHDHAGAGPADVEGDLLQEDREVNRQNIMLGHI